MDKITKGDLKAVADVRSNPEFNKLSDGINHMLSSIDVKITEVEEASHANRISGMQDVLETSLKQTTLAIEGQLKKMDDFLTNGNLHSFANELKPFLRIVKIKANQKAKKNSCN